MTGANGTLVASAGRDLNPDVVTESTSHHIVWDANNQRSDATRTDIGTTIQTQGDIRLQAGGDINAKAANVSSAQGAVLATADGSVKLTAGQATVQVDETHQQTSKGLFSSKTTRNHDTLDQTAALGSTFSGNTTTVLANQDIQVQGSNVVSTQGTLLAAQNNITVEAAKNTKVESHLKDEKLSGLFGTGGIGFTVGTRQQSVNQDGTTSTAAASTVGSTEGNVSLQAGKNYSQVGSQVLTPQGNIDIAAQKVDITEARDTSQNQTETKFKQSGLTLALTSPVITALQTAQQMKQASSQTSDSRMQLLAGASTAMAGLNAYSAVKAGQGSTIDGKPNQITTTDAAGNPTSRDATAADQVGGINLSISIGGSKSQSNTVQTSDNAAGSTVAAGGDITIRATGTGQNSDLTVQGSSVKAGNNVTLQADDQINLLAAQSTADQHSTNKSISGSIGFSVGTGGMGITVSASGARGNADGSDVTQVNTHVEAGKQLSLQSGGDTTLKGAVAKADQVTADIGGNLHIESLQDTSKFDSKQKSIGGSVTMGAGVSGSLSASKSKVSSDYASVTEQSGIQAADGGFQVHVAGNTDLKGGAITSTEAAIDGNVNQFKTGGVLTTSDIQNQASYSAKSVGINVGSGFDAGGKLAPSGTSAGFGADSGNASSITQAAISGIAGNKDARTGDKEAGIHKVFDADKVQKDIDAQVQITQTFGREAPKAVASFAQSQSNDLKAQAKAAADAGNPEQARTLIAEAKKWDEGGVYRIAIHTATGALSGSIDGALGAAAVASAAPLLNELQGSIAKSLLEAGASDKVAKAAGQLIAGATAAGIGAVASGGATAGAAMGLNIDANNRQLHPTEAQLIKDNAARYAKLVYKTEQPTAEQVQAATSMLVNTAQYDLDNNLGGTIPHSQSAEEFLMILKAEYVQKNGSFILPDSDGKQLLFYATREQKSQSWLNQDLADPQLTKLIVMTPLNPPLATDKPDNTRDKLTGLPLDDNGRYARQVAIGDPVGGYKNFEPKFFPCANAECINSGANLDMSDPGTQAYVKALDAQVFKDLNTGATAATLFFPVGAAGNILQVVGPTTSVAAGIIEDKPLQAVFKEGLQAGAGAYLQKIYGFSEALANRVVAMVDLAGGWQAFVDRSKQELFGEKK